MIGRGNSKLVEKRNRKTSVLLVFQIMVTVERNALEHRDLWQDYNRRACRRRSRPGHLLRLIHV